MENIVNIRNLLKDLPGIITLRVAEITIEKPDFKIIRDQYGEQHKLAREKFSSAEWASLKVGRGIVVPLRWSTGEVWLLPKKAAKAKEKEPLLDTELGAYAWACMNCGVRGVFDSLWSDNVARRTKEVTEEHDRKKPPSCSRFVVKVARIYSDDVLESPELTQMISEELSKIPVG